MIVSMDTQHIRLISQGLRYILRHIKTRTDLRDNRGDAAKAIPIIKIYPTIILLPILWSRRQLRPNSDTRH